MKEIQTLPIGPKEISTLWYAPARLAYMLISIYVAGPNWPKGKWYSYTTRVMEKNTVMMTAVAIDLFSRLNLVDIHTCRWWMDPAVYWRNYAWMGTLMIHIMQTYKINMDYGIGMEQHWKTQNDGS